MPGNNNHSKEFMEFMAKKLRWQERRNAEQLLREKYIIGLTERAQQAQKTAESYKNMVGEMNVGGLTAALRYLKNAVHDLYLNVMQSKTAQNVASLLKRSESVKPRPLPKSEEPDVEKQNKELLAQQTKAERDAVVKVDQKFKAGVEKVFAETTAAEKALDEIQLQKAKAAELQLQIEHKQSEAKKADLKVQEEVKRVLEVESDKKASTTPGAPKLGLDEAGQRLLNGDISQKQYADEKNMSRSELRDAGKVYDQLMSMAPKPAGQVDLKEQLEKQARDVALVLSTNDIKADDLLKMQNQASNDQKQNPALENNNPVNPLSNLMNAMNNASKVKDEGLSLIDGLTKLLELIMKLVQDVLQNINNAQAASDDLVQYQAQSESENSRDDMRPRPSNGKESKKEDDEEEDSSQYQQSQSNNQSFSDASPPDDNSMQSPSSDDTRNNPSSSNTSSGSGSRNTSNDADSPGKTAGVNSSDSTINSSTNSYADPETSASPGMSGVNATLQTAGEQFDGSMKEFSASTKEGLTTANTSFSPQTEEKGGQIDFSSIQNSSSMQSPNSAPRPTPSGSGGAPG